MKYIPTLDDKKRFQYDLLNRYGVYYDDYVKQFQCAPLLPSGCHLTSYGLEFLRQSHYSIILHNESRIFGTSAVLIFHSLIKSFRGRRIRIYEWFFEILERNS